ncbi:hypothetical protein [Devosia chinhatensis]|uniref:hypothetical protein n=1 Tax=Devosia chinhatensis TaxID=429727 RepID=UPI000AF5C28B|nr:hypothetical protein [Devosia chinhatensis]
MNQYQIRNLEDAGRSTAVWASDVFDHQPRFADVAMALLPATLILVAATALLVALL